MQRAAHERNYQEMLATFQAEAARVRQSVEKVHAEEDEALRVLKSRRHSQYRAAVELGWRNGDLVLRAAGAARRRQSK